MRPLGALAWRIQALRSEKARRALRGQREWRAQLANLPLRRDGVPRIQFHAASVGEFEQAKPVIEALRRRGPACITASFFSPSGYEQQRPYAALDAACYLPRDTRAEMRAFFERTDPDVVVVMRYDLWPEFMAEARRRSVPVLLACGVLRSDSSRFNRLWRRFFARMYGGLTHVFAVSEADRAAFLQLAPELAVTVSGDTRYDRVLDRMRSPADPGLLPSELLAGRTVLVAGSTWPPDEALLEAVAAREDLALVIVPHEPSQAHVDDLCRQFPGSVRLSELQATVRAQRAAPVLIVDRTGILSLLYRVGAIAYVGGAFGEGVHSVLEPAAYGVPVLSGPRIGRSRDAEEMRAAGILQIVRTPAEMAAIVEGLLQDAGERERLGEAAARFVAERAGATDRIVEGVVAAMGVR